METTYEECQYCKGVGQKRDGAWCVACLGEGIVLHECPEKVDDESDLFTDRRP